MRRPHIPPARSRAVALVVAVGVLTIIYAVAAALVGASRSVQSLVLYTDLEVKALYAALGGIQYGVSSLRTFAGEEDPPTSDPQFDNGFALDAVAPGGRARGWFSGQGFDNAPAVVTLLTDSRGIAARFRIGLVNDSPPAPADDPLIGNLTFSDTTVPYTGPADANVFIIRSDGEVVDTQAANRVLARVRLEQRVVGSTVTPFRLERR